LKRLRLVSVEEAMIKDPPRVTAEDSLEKAVSLMEEHGHISIIMVGPRGRARGIVYLSDARGQKGTVGEHHDGLKGSVNMKDDLRSAVSLMFRLDESSLPVVDDEGFYKGYITQRGITHILGATYRDH
jgi:osmoprotectant transport system ATP-binding protein